MTNYKRHNMKRNRYTLEKIKQNDTLIAILLVLGLVFCHSLVSAFDVGQESQQAKQTVQQSSKS